MLINVGPETTEEEDSNRILFGTVSNNFPHFILLLVDRIASQGSLIYLLTTTAVIKCLVHLKMQLDLN